MLNGKTAVVTGAGSGIGKSIGITLLQQGAKVVFSDISQDRLEQVKEEVIEQGLTAAIITCDVSSSADVDTLIDQAIERLGHIDILVNCAGIYDGYAGIEETSEALWDRIMSINLTGSFYTCKKIAPHIITRPEGRIINISSVGGLKGSADGLAYTTSKFGMIGMTKRLSIDLGKYGVTVNAVCPGVIKTNIRNNSAEILSGDGPDMQKGVGVSQEFLDNAIPLKRGGEPVEIAEMVVFLASEKAAYITGQSIAVDGGWTAT